MFDEYGTFALSMTCADFSLWACLLYREGGDVFLEKGPCPYNKRVKTLNNLYKENSYFSNWDGTVLATPTKHALQNKVDLSTLLDVIN